MIVYRSDKKHVSAAGIRGREGYMKKLGVALLALSSALLLVPGAAADPLTGSVAIAGLNDITFNATGNTFTNSGIAFASGPGGTLVAGPVKLTGFNLSNPDGVELFDISAGLGSPVTFTLEGNIAEGMVNGMLSISGSGLLADSGYATNNPTFDLSASSLGQSEALEITTVGAPEPSSLLLLGTGLLGLAFGLFRKARPRTVTVHK